MLTIKAMMFLKLDARPMESHFISAVYYLYIGYIHFFVCMYFFKGLTMLLPLILPSPTAILSLTYF